jgi:glycosyltransferase involved in cell wall biosynthesis
MIASGITRRSPLPTGIASMRVLHVTGATGREGAGVQAAVEGMAAELGTRATIRLALAGILPPAEQWNPLVDIHAPRIRVACHPPRMFSYAPDLPRVIDEFAPDILHQHGIWQYSGIVAARMRESLGVRVIVSPHGMLAPRALAHRAGRKRMAWSLYQRRALTAADLFHVTSQGERDDLRALGLRQPVAMIPFGVGVPSRCPPRHNKGPMTALFLSRIHPIKGVLDLVHAWDRVRPAGWRLVIAGPDECNHTAQVAAAVASVGLAGDVELRGGCWGEDRDRLIDASDLFILPSHSENFGIIVAEALARGVPVLTTQGTPWQVVEAEGCGWSVPVGVDGLAGGLARACRLDRTALVAMGRRGWELVTRDYGWPAATDRLIATYDWILNRGPQPECVYMESA